MDPQILINDYRRLIAGDWDGSELRRPPEDFTPLEKLCWLGLRRDDDDKVIMAAAARLWPATLNHEFWSAWKRAADVAVDQINCELDRVKEFYAEAMLRSGGQDHLTFDEIFDRFPDPEPQLRRKFPDQPDERE